MKCIIQEIFGVNSECEGRVTKNHAGSCRKHFPMLLNALLEVSNEKEFKQEKMPEPEEILELLKKYGVILGERLKREIKEEIKELKNLIECKVDAIQTIDKSMEKIKTFGEKEAKK